MTSRSNVDQLDGYLIRALCALVEERSVSRAARRMGQTQPAVSAALKRLRLILSDPLLVRNKLDMIPTERGLQLAAQARVALDAMSVLVASREDFDAQRASLTFRVASPDYLAPSVLAEVARRIREEAPLCRLEVHPMGPDFDSERALADDLLDVIIGNWPNPPELLHTLLLLEDELVCMVRPGHPLADAEALTEAQYLSASHVAPMRYSGLHRGVVETHLARQHVARDARVSVPYFGLAPHVVARTDLVFTTARHFAEHFAQSLGLVILKAPSGFPTMRFYQLWHERAHLAPAHRWLRAVIAEVGRAHAPKPA
ncbi:MULTISPECIES: LysR family transcriptional regulator [unclassified Variovorax]|uniref:LysR family transcriptional regulator n=1 Tax=unclassified Variovorax TaxID=663243 RepID=UPI001BD68CF8|nr:MULTISPECIES: LysR family transcriptional regulator [unclassified Variovorax]